eukprot:gene8651-11694_t
MFQKFDQFIGHKDVVNCLDYFDSNDLAVDIHSGAILASGSEDKTLRLWDIRSLKSIKCFHSCFNTGIESVKFGYNNFLLYAASGNTIFSFDIRFEGILCKEPISTMSGFDDINSITIHPKNGHMAVGDDSGSVVILPMLSNGKFCENNSSFRHKRLSRVHSSIINIVQYKYSNPKFLVSGGFDCKLCNWDTSTCRSKNITDFTGMNQNIPSSSEMNDSPNQVFNPPFVHALNYLYNDNLLACALGDGSLAVLDTVNYEIISKVEDHNGMSTVLFAANDLIITGGVDQVIRCWQIHLIDGEDECIATKASKKSKTKAENLTLTSTNVNCELKWEINHHSKLNAIIAPKLFSSSNETPFFVCDTTSNITMIARE